MKCPSCGNLDAYQGLSTISCPNSNCRYGEKSVITIAPPQPGSPSVKPGNHPLMGQPTGNSGNLPGQGNNTQVGAAILSQTPKINSVMITFKGWGDPGYPDKRVEFYFTTPGGTKTICTLSNALRYYVDGVDADNHTTYTTHWMCTNDGVRPSDQFTLECVIYP